MKHTFWFIDKLLFVLKDIEHYGKGALETEEQKRRAKEDIEKLKKYDKILRKLIHAHKTEEYLKTLHACHVDAIPNWVEEVASHLKKLDQFLKVLEEDIPKLEQTIENEPHMWGSRVRDMSFGIIMAGIRNEEHSLIKFREAAVFERKHLKEILDDLEEVEELLE